MFIKQAIILIAASVTLLLAAPVEESPRSLAARDSVNMKLCINANFDSCTTFNLVGLGVCQNVPTNLNDRISSIDHSQPHSCRFWKDAGCTGDFIGGNQDTYSDLAQQGFNDRISSWRCS